MTFYMRDKINSFAPLFLINDSKFLWQDEDGNYATEYYRGHTLNTVNNPAIGYTEKSEQLVRSTRDANGRVIAQLINRRLNKIDSLTWPYLSRKSVNWLKQQIAKFDCKLTYWDDEKEAWISRMYYWGDFEATPCEWETVERGNSGFYYKRPTWYKDVKCNLIDKRLLIKKGGNYIGFRTTILKYTSKTRRLYRYYDVYPRYKC